MVYFCLTSSSQPSSRCIINVESPPSAHAQRSHEDNDFHSRCAPVITKSLAFFRFRPVFPPISSAPQAPLLPANGCFHFLHHRFISEWCRSSSSQRVIVAQSGQPAADPAGGCASRSPSELKTNAAPSPTVCPPAFQLSLVQTEVALTQVFLHFCAVHAALHPVREFQRICHMCQYINKGCE